MGRYMKNEELRALDRALGKKKGKSGCMGCVTVLFLGLIAFAVLASLAKKEVEDHPVASGTGPGTVPDPTLENPVNEIEISPSFPVREWEINGKKVKARFVKWDAEKPVLFVLGGSEKGYALDAFSEKDLGYLEGIKNFPSKITPVPGASEKEWTYFSGRKPFKAMLLLATDHVVLLKEKEKMVLYCRQDFSFQDWEYLTKMGF